MKKRIFKWTLSVCMLSFIFQSVPIAKADHDDYDHDYYENEKYERHEKDHDRWKVKEHDDWKDDEKEWEKEWEGPSYKQEQQMQPSYWNVWTRDTSTSLTEKLPFQEAKEVAVEVNGKSKNLYVVPFNGQLLVPGKKMAQLLGLEAKFYKQSRILEVTKDKDELIVRAGSNAAYENMIKTPMPSQALYYEKSVYLPISVIANAFGYRVNWDEATGTISLKNIQ